MLFRTIVLLCFLALFYQTAGAQNTTNTDSLVSKTELVEMTEEVDGLMEFAGFLGKKLIDSVSSQFEDEQPEEKKSIKRVRIKLGPIKIERIEKS
jgi:hypothetical protein